MPYRNFDPVRELKSHIKCCWYAERSFAIGDSFDILPDGYIELVFCMPENRVFYHIGDQTHVLPNTFVVGLLDSPLKISTNGLLRTIGIRFYPWGFYDLFKPRPEPLSDLSSHVLIQAAENIIDGHAPGYLPDQCISEVQHLFSIVVPRSPDKEDKVRLASEVLGRERGLKKIKELATEQYVSTRQLDRLFNEKIGQSPKALAQLIRFENIRDRIYQCPTINLTQLAYEFDYADQSHFIADFKRYAGKNPRAFARDMKRLKSALSEYNVRFSQV